MKAFILWFNLISLGISLSLLVAFSQAAEPESDNPYAGMYELVVPPVPTSTDRKVEVVELFWYTCPHCFHFEKEFLTSWLKNISSDVVFLHMPAVFNEKNIFFAKVYYTAEALNILNKIHMPLFDAIHNQRRQLDEAGVRELFLQQAGINEQDFQRAFDSFGVDTQVRRANELTVRYGNKVVPTIVVNGKYRLSSEMTDGYVNMMKVIDYLIEKERKLMATGVQKPLSD